MTLLRQNVLFTLKFKEVSSSIHPYTSALLSFFEIDLMFTPRNPFHLLFFRRVYLKNTLSIIYSFTFDTINSHFQFSIVSDFVKSLNFSILWLLRNSKNKLCWQSQSVSKVMKYFDNFRTF